MDKTSSAYGSRALDVGSELQRGYGVGRGVGYPGDAYEDAAGL
jgi:hypothetical protein